MKINHEHIPSFEEMFKLMNINCWLLGIDGVNVHFRFYVIAIIYIPILFEEGGFLVTKASNASFVTLLGLIPCITYCILSILKILAAVLNRVKIVELMKSVNHLYLIIIKNEKKKRRVRRDVLFVNKLTKYLFLLNVVLLCVYCISTLIIIPYLYITTHTIEYVLPFPVLVPFSTDAWIPWLVVYIHSCLCGYICVIYITTVDALYFILVTHVCINFMVLGDDFLDLRNNNFTNLNECIKNHQYIMKLSEELDVIFRLPNFINIFVGSFQICALGFCITVGEWADIPGYFMFLSTILAQIWMISMFGEKIMTSSSKINESVWSCYWDCTNVNTQKSIMMILMRSQKPQKLTAYLFSTVSCSSFRKILSNSWSYFSILRSVYKPPEINNE